MKSAKREKAARNKLYADRYRQRVCENKKCKHRSCKPGVCRVCGGKMKGRKHVIPR